ncbi:hypothetical membrane protein [Corynebacterium kutscheri]|uniref:Hypothetical membrane protein n=1 Tax=Corynebacterium kutscheri TaxID=35755 RepID=A0A0F6QYX7_9CORY|nr:DUF3817 domain-containing protein [Corynebacterium kutscheri]AKE40842.1 integral membrane protein [Corynebacterium kutscheri]VEH06566.1 hypothetical membrane protein [Corynebacterium kutscheri]VEH09139.1 hypothetical membrane protein [Corynebacterium kutscheri]VEH82483.1 hypothetical membrane protein [Corynebacterium kutscheri]
MSEAKQVHPERQRRVRSALQLFSISAWVTGVFLLVLVTRMVCEYLLHLDIPAWAHYIGQVHGLFYALFLLATLNLGTKALWPPQRWLMTAISGVVPFLSFYVERQRRKEVTAEFQLAQQ